MNYTFHLDSPLGKIVLASDGEVLTGLWFEDQKYALKGLETDAKERLLPVFEKTKLWLDRYFKGEEPDFMPPYQIKASDFQMEVYAILSAIPYGETMSYSKIASMIAMKRGIRKMSAQAVGSAVSRNPICLIVPCHRVIGKNGELVGYAGGIERKKILLDLEKARKKSS